MSWRLARVDTRRGAARGPRAADHRGLRAPAGLHDLGRPGRDGRARHAGRWHAVAHPGHPGGARGRGTGRGQPPGPPGSGGHTAGRPADHRAAADPGLQLRRAGPVRLAAGRPGHARCASPSTGRSGGCADGPAEVRAEFAEQGHRCWPPSPGRAAPPPDRAASPSGRPDEGPVAAAAADRRPGRRGGPAGRAGAGRAGRHPEPARGHHGGPGAVARRGRAAPASSCAPAPWWPPRTGRRTCWSTRPTRPTSRHRSPRQLQERPAATAGPAHPDHLGRRLGLRPPVRGVAAAVADRAGRRAERADPRRADRPARPGRIAAGWYTPEAVAHELRLARPPRRPAGPGDLLHRAVRLGQVHAWPGTCGTR